MLLSKDKFYKAFFYLYFFLLPIVAALESISSGSNKIFNAIFMVLLVFAVFDLYRRSWTNIYIVLFVVFSLSIFFMNSIVYGLDLASEYDPSMSEGIKIGFRILMLAFMTYFAYLLTRFEVLKIKDLMYISFFLVFSMLIGQIIGSDDISTVSGEGNEFALQGLVGHVAITSSVLLSVVPILLINSSKSTLNFLVLALCFTAIIFTFRRSAWLIFIVLGLAHLYMMYFRNNSDALQKLKVMVLIIAGTVGIGVLLMLNQDVSNAIMTRLEDLNVAQGGTGAGRSVFWGILWDYTLNQPMINFFVGNGYGFIQGLLENRFGSAIGAHNDWLDFFLSFGVLPLIIFAIMVIILTSYTLQKNRVHRQLLAYCLFCLVTLSMTTGGAFDTYFAFLHATIGFALASQDNAKESSNG